MRLYFLIFIIFSQQSLASSISPRTYNLLNELQEKISEQPANEEAQEIDSELTELAADLKGNSLGVALTLQTHAQLKIYQDNQSQAQALLFKAVQLEGLDKNTLSQIQLMLAFSYYNTDQFLKAIELLKKTINLQTKPSANTYALIAASYYSLDDFKSGLPFISKACELTETPKEAWLQMAFSGYYQIKQYPDALSYLNKLVFNYPEKSDYWQQKAGLHQMLEQYNKAAATKDIAYKKGFLDKESDFINLSQLLASQGEAFKVGVVLEKAISENLIEPSEKALNILYQSWLQAKEINKAIIVLGELFENYRQPKHGYQLIQYLIDQEQWNKTDQLANKLLDIELSSSQRGKVLLYQGMAKYRQGDTRGAMLVLGKSTAFDSSSSQAKSWMSYIKQMES